MCRFAAGNAAFIVSSIILYIGNKIKSKLYIFVLLNRRAKYIIIKKK